MKTLYLVRHAKAIQRKAKVPDFQRPLVKTGEKSSLGMGKKLKKRGVAPDLLMSSTASRALETAHMFAKGLRYPVEKIMVRDALYNEMSAEALLRIIKQVDDTFDSLMLFGHNPAFTALAAHLIKDFSADIPKTGIVAIEFDKPSWKDLRKSNGRMAFFEYPRKLAKSYQQLRNDLEITLGDRVRDVFKTIDSKSAENVNKHIRGFTRGLVDEFLKDLKKSLSKEEQRAMAEKRRTSEKSESQAAPVPIKPPAPSAAPKAARAGARPARARRAGTAATAKTRSAPAGPATGARTRTRKTTAAKRPAAKRKPGAAATKK